ncbi:MAG: Bax inhibitor-1/YccA family protein [Prevotella sp.]|uniref:Bax inhibitor-1/YccA family protein n=1 Tax=uncultured Prevotella sp. TaxID=159272 RepID=UPI0025E133EA|nr:Bax inhibitor-1/YccA family protein [Prevotella sp.]MCI7183912.1 Bax inhibitor-1/YccA family protein [Prevotella sp.]
MKQENWYDVDSLRNKDFAMSTAFPALMRKVFVWMTLALAITGLTAYGVATSPTILSLIFSSKVTFFGLIIAEFALVFAISGAINRLSLSTATMLFILYSVINGATLSSIFFAFSVATIGKVFFITAGTFGAMALVGYTTKTDLTSMGKLLFMALLGIIIASVVNMFVASSGLDLILSYVGVLVFVGLTAYDTQKIKQMCQAAPDAGESAQKLALIGALSLYLDFINLFLYLLRIFGNNRD